MRNTRLIKWNKTPEKTLSGLFELFLCHSQDAFRREMLRNTQAKQCYLQYKKYLETLMTDPKTAAGAIIMWRYLKDSSLDASCDYKWVRL